jgi:hypothetical protein
MLETVAFWAAVAHLLLLVVGLDTLTARAVFVGLVVLDAVAVVVGHPHHSDDRM